MRADPGAPAASRTRLPCLPRHCASGAAVRRRSPRSRRHPGDRDRHADLRLGALDPRQQARSPGGTTAAYQWCADPPPQYPRTALLPLRRMPLLTHPMLDQLGQLGLSGMAQAFAELEASDETAALTHADWLGLLLDREAHPSPRQAACSPAALCQTAPAGQRRGRRLPGPTRPRPRALPEAHEW